MYYQKPTKKNSVLIVLSVLICCTEISGTSIFWGTHLGPAYLNQLDDVNPSSIQAYLYGLDGEGTNKAKLANGSTTGNVFDGDLIELGFFDTDGEDDSSYTPNTDASNPFKGIWTPLTSQTTIGRDWDGSTTVAEGEFYFKTNFTELPSIENESTSNFGETLEFTDNLGNSDDPNELSERIDALQNTSTLLGIRFYDINTASASAGGGGTTKATNGTTRYNTIMLPTGDRYWNWEDGFLSLHNEAGSSTDSGLVFEFDNSDYNAISDIGTGGTNAVGTDDFVATVTYYDGSTTLNMTNSGIGDTILSGLNSGGTIQGGDDNILTINSSSGNSYTYSGAVQGTSGAGAFSIVKTGLGEQIFTGAINLAGTSTGYVDIYEGNVTFKGADNTQTFEYLTSTDDSDGSTTPIVRLDNTTAGSSGEIIELGFSANTGITQTFDGNVVLSGGNTAHKIKIASGASDYNRTQIISGTITGDHAGKTLVKDGAGILALHGDSASTMDGGIEIQDGTLLIGDGSDAGADPGDGTTITITKGKLEIAASETIDNTINTDNSNKSILGGGGTYDGAVTVGEDGTNFIDVISPGSGISSSLSNPESQQQISLGDRTNAIGTFTISDTLTLASGGVYDWEISDFTNAGDDSKAGVDWDLLKFDALTYNPNDSFTINIMGLSSDGSAGPMTGDAGNVWGTYLQEGGASNGFKFMEFTGTKSWGNEPAEAGVLSNFTIQDSGWKHYNTHHLNQWSVYWDGTSSFYLQYSAVPEPSTYMMVTGLLMVPGMSYLRRIRRKKDTDQEETSL